MKWLLFILVVCASCKHLSIRPSYDTCKARYGHSVYKDSIIVKTVEVTVPGTRTDTVVRLNKVDTLVLTKDNLRVEVIKEHDIYHVKGQCDTIKLTETIRVPVPVEIVKFIDKDQPFYRNSWFWTFLALLFGLAFFAFLSSRR